MQCSDWLWPAIWMLPTDNLYGSWPMSGKQPSLYLQRATLLMFPGEIDIMEARGNGPAYPYQCVSLSAALPGTDGWL